MSSDQVEDILCLGILLILLETDTEFFLVAQKTLHTTALMDQTSNFEKVPEHECKIYLHVALVIN